MTMPKPCPICNADLMAYGAGDYEHPLVASCLLSNLYLAPDEIDGWNVRVADSALTQISQTTSLAEAQRIAREALNG